MRILITGNIASGKSTLIAGLIERLYEADIHMAHIGIDHMRALYSDGTPEGEALARMRYKRAVEDTPYCFIECCPYSRAYEAIAHMIDYTVLVVCDTALCIERYSIMEARYSGWGTHTRTRTHSTIVADVMAVNSKVKRVPYNVTYAGGSVASVFSAICLRLP